MPRWAPIFLVAAAAFVVDQAAKFAVLMLLPLHESIPLIPSVFRLTHIHNPGAAFGILAGEAGRPFFVALSVFAVLFILYLFRKEPRAGLWRRSAFGLILGGAVGNLVDRLRYEAVVDFLHFSTDFADRRWEFAVFNLADAAICGGVAILVLEMAFSRRGGAPEAHEPIETPPPPSAEAPA